jgi:hypothetical protein
MRRLVPWSLLTLLGIGTGLGATLAVSSAPHTSPTAWVSGVLTTTATAGSARFTYTHITTSSSRAERDRTSGSGEVDFTTGSVRVTEIDHDIQVLGLPSSLRRYQPSTSTEMDIGIGTTLYSDPFGGGPGPIWTKLTRWRDPHSDLGLSAAANADVALQGLDGPLPVTQVRTLGPAILDGQPTTRYLISTTPLRACRSAPKSTLTDTQGPTTIWLNSQGRLVRAQISFHESGHLPARILAKTPQLDRIPMAPSTTTATLEFSDFGASVHVAAPPARLIENDAQSRSFSIEFKKCGS